MSSLTAASRRRNGSQPSCEPCRRAKTRCDHQRPICGRCQRRGPDVRCWYHPNPLTKLAAVLRNRSNSNDSSKAGSLPRTPDWRRHASPTQTSPSQGSHAQSRHVHRFSVWPGVNNADSSPSSQTAATAGSAAMSPSTPRHPRTQDDQLAVAIELLEQLVSLPLMETLVRDYFEGSQVPLVPAGLVMQMISTLSEYVAIDGLLRQQDISDHLSRSDETRATLIQAAEKLLRTSSTEVDIAPSMRSSEFCSLYSGPNIRVETLGLIYTISARSLIYNAAYDESKDSSLTLRLFRCSNLSLRLARDIAPQVNDVVLWLAHENLLFVTLMEGDASIEVWRRLGDLATEIFALGLHRETAQSLKDVPFFLTECRRRTYASVYQVDKAFANMFSRPPRLSKRYASCKLPLDLPDDALLAESSTRIQTMKNKLTKDGWNSDGQYGSSTWARIRAILGEFREELIEFVHMADPPTVLLRNLAERCRVQWEGVPAHVRYTRECWTDGPPTGACFMLGKVYLSYLHIHMQIYRLLAKTESNAFRASIQISIDMFDTVLQMGSVRSRGELSLASLLTRQILTYGLPCANILMATLEETPQDSLQTTPSLPGFNRATVIRNLSVFVSHLENVCEPREANHVFCMQAARSVSQRLDDILIGLSSVARRHGTQAPDQEQPQAGFRAPSQSGDLSSDHIVAAAADTATENATDFDAIDLETLDSFDPAQWNVNLDFGGFNGAWHVF